MVRAAAESIQMGRAYERHLGKLDRMESAEISNFKQVLQRWRRLICIMNVYTALCRH